MKSEKTQNTGCVSVALVEQYLLEIQECMENLPCGGIGKDGPSQSDLDAANEEGHPVEDDSSHHQAQQAWLFAQRAIDLLSSVRNQE